MSIRLQGLDNLPPNSVVIVYDIEGIGDVSSPSKCFMWNLSAMILNNSLNSFDQFIYPHAVIPEPPDPKLFKVTTAFLTNANAMPCAVVLDYFFKWIHNNYDSENGCVVLVSHGNFRYDQPLIQTEMIRHQIIPPKNLYFLDTLHWFRSIKKGRKSYSLSSLYKDQFKKPIRNAHLALFDVHALNDLIMIQKQSLHGIMYKCFQTALLRIPSVGLFTESLLYNGGIDSLEQLVYKFINECLHDPKKLYQQLVKINIRPCIAATISQHVSSLC